MASIPVFNIYFWNEEYVDDNSVFGVAGPTPGVYFIQEGDGYDGLVKIGWSMNVGRRFDALQAAHGSELYIRLVCQPDICYPDSLRALERQLHKAFDRARVRSEWFEASNELTDFMVDPGSRWRALLDFEAVPSSVMGDAFPSGAAVVEACQGRGIECLPGDNRTFFPAPIHRLTDHLEMALYVHRHEIIDSLFAEDREEF